jgi:hypothetical protein
MKMRQSRLSRNSSLGMIALGVFTLIFLSGLVGLILIVIGVIMYQFYRRQATQPPRSEPSPVNGP